MRGLRHDRILASTALALIFAAPLGAFAQDSNKQDSNKLAAAFTERYPAEQTSTQTPPATATPANALPASSAGTAPDPSTATEQPAPPPDPLASLDPADRVIAEKIRDLLAAKSDRIFASKKERTAVEAFYQNRNLAPLWLDKGVENARARSVIARLKNADSDGLELSDYKTPNFAGPNSAGLGPDA